MRNKTSVTFVAASLALLVGNAAAKPYTFTNIADNRGPFSNVVGSSLNDSGTVAFEAFFENLYGIFTGNGGAITTIVDNSGPFDNFSVSSLNNGGTVAFHGSLDSDISVQGIFTGNGGNITTIADTSGPFASFDLPSINDSGTVAFQAFLDSDGIGKTNSGIFTGSGGPLTTIADSSGPFSGVLNTSLNNSGTVAFLGILSDDPVEQGIFTGSGGPLTTIADTSGPFDEFFQGLSINESGTVAFVGTMNGTLDSGTGQHGIFIGSGGQITAIVDNNGPFCCLGGQTINDSGTVAFFGALDEIFEGGIFTDPNLLSDKVIGIGDMLFGSTLTKFGGAGSFINNTGQITFNYELADGRTGIARADPLVTPVPEPGTLILLVAGLLGAVLWRKGNAT